MIRRLAGRFLQPSTENITEHFPGFRGLLESLNPIPELPSPPSVQSASSVDSFITGLTLLRDTRHTWDSHPRRPSRSRKIIPFEQALLQKRDKCRGWQSRRGAFCLKSVSPVLMEHFSSPSSLTFQIDSIARRQKWKMHRFRKRRSVG